MFVQTCDLEGLHRWEVSRSRFCSDLVLPLLMEGETSFIKETMSMTLYLQGVTRLYMPMSTKMYTKVGCLQVRVYLQVLLLKV